MTTNHGKGYFVRQNNDKNDVGVTYFPSQWTYCISMTDEEALEFAFQIIKDLWLK